MEIKKVKSTTPRPLPLPSRHRTALRTLLARINRIRKMLPGVGWMLLGIVLALGTPAAFTYAAAHRAFPAVGGEIFVPIGAIASLLAGLLAGGDT